MAAIVTSGLSKTYKALGKSPVHSLRSLDLQVEEREIFGFLGRNGAGKTTTIKLLTGLIRPTGGGAQLFGMDIGLAEARKTVGYMPEHPYFYEYLTPRETLDFYGRLRGLNREERLSEWERISALLDLREIADRRIRGFSKGMRQRVGFAVALVGDPPLLILDEPMSGLDPLGRRMIRELIKQLNADGKTIFFSSHVLSDVEEICDRVAILVTGKLAACDRIEGLVGDLPKSVEMCATEMSAALAHELKSRVANLKELEEGKYAFVVPDLATANQTAQYLYSRGAVLVSMHPVIESLEDFFARVQEGAGVDLPEENTVAALTSKAEE